MFIQVITGNVTDPEGFRRQTDKWVTDVRPGAVGFLGSTGGTTDDGRFIVLARFESAEAAAKNNERPQQSGSWAETEKTLEGAVFKDSTDIVTLLGGGKDDAGFVQVMRGRITDTEGYAKFRNEVGKIEDVLGAARPDVVGEVIAIHEDGTYTDVVYFSSEAEARANEAKPLTGEAQAMFDETMSSVEVDEFFDLKEPRIF